MPIPRNNKISNFQKHFIKSSGPLDAGFALVEMTITLIIIGLIVSCVIIKGPGLIEMARLNKDYSQVNEIKIAVSRFQDQFNALPGDYSEAKANIDNSLIDGNQNGLIEGDGLDPKSKAGQFWAHLSAKDLISNAGSVKTNGTDMSKSEMNFGSGAPSAKIGGGFTVQSNPTEDMPGLWLVLGAKNGTKGDGALLTPSQAKQLADKIDSSNPPTGDVRALSGSGKQCLTDQRTFNTSLKEAACVLYFKL